MPPSLPLLSCQSSVSVKENPDRKKKLHVKNSIRYTELKFQLGLANPRWNFNTGWKFQIFHIIDIFPTRDKNLILHTPEFLVYLKNSNGDFTRTFQMDRWQTYQSYKMLTRIQKLYVKFSFLNIDSFQQPQGFEIITVI